ncbi:hypothetical protein BS47DRAFT_820339 [Hydnum rufescens UP504]|uniref:Uncharacterized protein n=1 Tax=Hydnum rufescens UP504 TaxID=1448309 RepID=A0A9P6DXV0_9AGAM|nr:hypothetical protein BS47DRAFT_820339 [Hydnum rufescens UP504]
MAGGGHVPLHLTISLLCEVQNAINDTISSESLRDGVDASSTPPSIPYNTPRWYSDDPTSNPLNSPFEFNKTSLKNDVFLPFHHPRVSSDAKEILPSYYRRDDCTCRMRDPLHCPLHPLHHSTISSPNEPISRRRCEHGGPRKLQKRAPTTRPSMMRKKAFRPPHPLSPFLTPSTFLIPAPSQ